MPEDGYPTGDELVELVRLAHASTEYGWQTCRAAMTYMKTLWWHPDWGWHEDDLDREGRRITRYEISTGGWSGNEELLETLMNTFTWTLCWQESRRGGHYVFEIPVE